MPNDYHIQAQLDRTKRLRELQHELPDFCSDYFMAIEQQTSVLTRLSYAYDLKLFFNISPANCPNLAASPSPNSLRQISVRLPSRIWGW